MKKKTENYYTLQADEVLGLLETDAANGLKAAEVKNRLDQYGPNTLTKKEGKSLLIILAEQFNNPIIWILVAAMVLAIATGEVVEGIAVAVVIIINTLIGFFMEMQAVRSMEKLQSMVRARAMVIRGGKTIQIDTAEIVPGDILYIEAGDIIPADALVIEVNNLAVKEAALTGESNAVNKNTAPVSEGTGVADRKNSLYKGTIVARGNATAVVTATGDDTQLGRIAQMMHEAKKEATPLSKRLNTLSKKLIWLTLGITLLIFAAGVLRGKDLTLMIETAVALAVASIPEGLPVIATIALARGMLRLADKKVIVKTLEAVQTLGETEVIFTDKTGTLTENEMHVTAAAFADNTYLLPEKESKKDIETHTDYELLQTVAVLCNNSNYETAKGSEEKSTGDPLEVALLRMAHQISGGYASIQKEYKRLAEIPFDSDIKMMGTVNQHNNEYIVCAKGATEALLEKCTKEQVNGEAKRLEDDKHWIDKAEKLSAQGLRVLGFAYRTAESEPDSQDFINDLTFLGLMGFVDPVRKGIKTAVENFRGAGIRVIMITGDHPGTATAIAHEAGLGVAGEEIVTLTGKELAEGKGKAYEKKLVEANVFARVDPSQKLDLVSIYQKKKIVAGMTGDGVNDAPALKKADIGIAMGIRGTEAAKEAADLILEDDSFASIVTAVKQGRVIFNNIRLFVVYLLSCNLSEVFIVAIAAFFNLTSQLLPLQILMLNMVTDVFPALAIGMNKGENDVMQKRPRKSTEPILSNKNWVSLTVYAACMTVSVTGAAMYGHYMLGLNDAEVNNITFYTLLLVQLTHVFNLPERTVSFFKNQITNNSYVWYALALCIVLQVGVYLVPVTRNVLSLVPFDAKLLLHVAAGSVVHMLLVQFFKRVVKLVD